MLIANKSNHYDDQFLVSVIMNCFNGEKYLREAVKSVLNQTYKNWEIIFWDNQSTDSSAKIIKSYSDARIKYYYSSKHCNLYESRNFAIKKAKGAFIAFLDVDDIWFPNNLTQQIKLFNDPEVGFSCANYWIKNERNNKSWLAHKKIMPSGYVLDQLLREYSIGLLTFIIRRSALLSLGFPFDNRYHFIGDFDISIRLAVSWKLARVNSPIGTYRIHGENESSKQRSLQIAEIENWYIELAKDPIIGVNRNFFCVSLKITYDKGINALLLGNRVTAFSCIKALPWGIFKAKLMIATLLPKNILRRLKI